jgi:hypothetical protein
VTAETPTLDGGRLALKPAQEAALAALERGTLSDLTRAAYEEITGVSRSQAAYDLADLVALGLLERVGAGRATRYRLGKGAGGRPRKWTDERIRSELEAFCAEVGRWPRAVEFRDSGRGDLYLAASRYGGIDYWAAELGLRAAANGDASPARRSPAASIAKAARASGVDLDLGRNLLAGAIVVFAVAFVGLLFFADRGPRSVTTRSPDTVVGGAPLGEGRVAGAELVESGPEKRDARLTLRLSAASASSWLVARLGSADGKVLFRGMLATGRSLRLRGKRLWLRLGAPAGLRARLDGDALRLPPRTSTILVRKKGLRVLDLERPAPPPAEEPVVASQPVVYTPPSTDSSGESTASSPPPPPPSADDAPSPDPRPAGPGPDDPKRRLP